MTAIKLLTDLTGPEMVHLWNQLTGETINRFASRQAGLARFQKLVDRDPALAEKLNTLLTSQGTQFDDGGPVPTVEDVIEHVAEKARDEEAARETDKQKEAERDARMRRKLSPREQAMGIDPERPVPIVLSKQGRVRFRGKAVLPENVERLRAGEALSGAVLEPPKEKDACQINPRLNFNYKRKAVIKPMRLGTIRAAMVAMMTQDGITVEEVMDKFRLNYDQAVYRIRDLHYTSGHGMKVVSGRVFLNDEE